MTIQLHKGSVRLASLYLIILLTISLSFSVVIYQLSVQELARGLRGPGVIINRQVGPGFSAEVRDAINNEREEVYIEAKQRVLERLVVINFIILLVGGAMSYYLALKTLQPIEEAHETQNRFTADASHELRTPITAMLTENEVTLMDPKLSVKEAKLQLKSNIEELQKLSALSDSLLRLAGLENSELHKDSVNVQNVIQNVISRAEHLAEAKNINIVPTSPDSELLVIGDEKSIEEAIFILVDNAIKYSPENTTVHITATSRKQKQVSISVKDNGIGISAKDTMHIFDRFYRADTSRTSQSTSGHGLGLAIAKNIAEQHNGTINVSSKLHKGSTFTITLPVA